MVGTVIPRFWRPLQIGDFIYLVSSCAYLLHTYNLKFGDFEFGNLNFAQPKTLPKSRDYCTYLQTGAKARFDLLSYKYVCNLLL